MLTTLTDISLDGKILESSEADLDKVLLGVSEDNGFYNGFKGIVIKM